MGLNKIILPLNFGWVIDRLVGGSDTYRQLDVSSSKV